MNVKTILRKRFCCNFEKDNEKENVWVLVGQELVGEILEKGLEAKCTGPGAARGTR